MSKMAEFVEENLMALDDLPDGCTRNLVNDSTWRAEHTLYIRERGDDELFLIIRFALIDTGAEVFGAKLSLHEWHSDNGVTGSDRLATGALDRLAIGTLDGMTESLRGCLDFWCVPTDVADSADVQHFLRFVESVKDQLGEHFTELSNDKESAND